jgi:hypothetical protein
MSQATMIAISIVSAAVGLVLLGLLIGLLLWKRRHASEASSEDFGSSSSHPGQPFHSGVSHFFLCLHFSANLSCGKWTQSGDPFVYIGLYLRHHLAVGVDLDMSADDVARVGLHCDEDVGIHEPLRIFWLLVIAPYYRYIVLYSVFSVSKCLICSVDAFHGLMIQHVNLLFPADCTDKSWVSQLVW